MADISKVKLLDGVTYDLKDATLARILPLNAPLTKSIVLNGSEFWKLGNTYTNCYRFDLEGSYNVYTDDDHIRGYGETSKGTWIQDETFGAITELSLCFNYGVSPATKLYVIVPKSEGVSTVAGFKAWLAADPITITYTLYGDFVPKATYSDGEMSYSWDADGLMSSSEKTKLNSFSGVVPVIGTQTAATGAWTGNINIPALYDGLTIAYYLPWGGSGNATLNLTLSNGTTTGAVDCYFNSTTRLTTHYGVGSTILLTYWSAGSISVNGTVTTNNRWTRCDYYNGHYFGYCATEAGTAAKVAYLTGYKLRANNYCFLLLQYGNTYAGALTLNIGGTGAKPLYINATASSSSNYTLPAGTYWVFYDGTNYHVRTDARLTANILGDAETVNRHTVNADVPSGAVFTDTTYSAGTNLSLSGTTFNHSASGVTAGTYGSATTVPSITVDAQGHVTGVTAASLPAASTSVAGITTVGASGGAAAYSHTHSTYAPLASPAFTGTPTTAANTSYTTRQIRSITLSTSEPTSSDGQNGDLWFVYEA